MGLVQRLGGLDDALAWASTIAGLAPLTIAAHKLGLERIAERADDPDYAAARLRAWRSSDLQEGLAAFKERRPPNFRGE
jgi:enoyl-CoA hydratase